MILYVLKQLHIQEKENVEIKALTLSCDVLSTEFVSDIQSKWTLRIELDLG